MLSLEGCIVTADALHCNRPMQGARKRRPLRADSQGKPKQIVCGGRALLWPLGQAQRDSSSQALTIDPKQVALSSCARATWKWQTVPGVAAIGRITSRRRLHGPAGKPAVRYYVLSKYMPAKRFLQVVRSHWSIENQLHWVLDVVFGEDACRTRTNMVPRTLPPSGGTRSISFAPTQPASPCAKRLSARGGKTPSFPNSSAACDGPTRNRAPAPGRVVPTCLSL
ncbi:ISAs1 family transposase [Bradyrhizobium sp. ISRA442]|uniref:ISAs1 family transposase n=1 Tax=Bradyrhizobium sp. ISRA442 TaxID=2866197 RepID=UPI004049BA16